MKWSHPELGDIEQMPVENQRWKGWKHLHEPRERWDGLLGFEDGVLLSRAKANGCPRRGWAHVGDRSERLAHSCVACMHRHHDRWWREAYGQALLDPRTVHGRSRRRGRPMLFASPRGIFIVLTAGGGRKVNTVYRPHPLGRSVLKTDRDFHDQALRRFEKETGVSTRDLNTGLARELRGPADVWLLALDVGAAQAGPGDIDQAMLDGAVERIRSAPHEWLDEARPDPEEVLSALEAALDESADPDDVVTVSAGVEDALVVLAAMGEVERRARLLESALDLVGWAPPAWLDLEPLARARVAESRGDVQMWWSGVVEACEGLEVSEAPIHDGGVPTTSTARLFAPSWWERWRAALEGVGARVRELVHPAAAGWELGAAQMSAAAGAWSVTPGRPLPRGARVFIVDADEPDGVDVTPDYEAGEPIWLLEQPGQEARIIVLTGGGSEASLAAALEAARGAEGAQVEVVRVTRPA